MTQNVKNVVESVLNEWWGEQGFHVMRTITGFAFYEFNPKDGYQEYIDHCDKIWDNFTYEQKLSAYYSIEQIA